MFTYHIAIVDEDPAYRWSVRTTLQAVQGLSVDLEASTGQEALTLAETTRPDLFVIGRQLPGLNGLLIGAAIRHHFPRSRVVILTTNLDDEQCFTALRFGASALLPRFGDHETLRSTVRTILHGEEPLRIWAKTQTHGPNLDSAQEIAGVVGQLTTRELAVFDCLLMGQSTKETATTLRIADQTVKNRISSVLHKLEIEGRMAAIRLALNNGWVEYGVRQGTGPLPNDSRPDRISQRMHPAAMGASEVLRHHPGMVIPVPVLPGNAEHTTWN